MKQKTWKNRQKAQRLFKKKGPWEEELGNHEMAGSVMKGGVGEEGLCDQHAPVHHPL
jgi:hypothetical protein